MSCPICSNNMQPCFTAMVLGKYQAQYEVCKNCGFLRIRDPYWLEEAYASAIATADTGLIMRNFSLACKVATTLYWVTGDRGKGRYLDAAGGYGMLTRLMRDLGFDFYWSDKYCTNLLASGFGYAQENGLCNAVTAMEVLEHLTDPLAFIKETLCYSGAQTFLFSTWLYEGEPPSPDSWWYYSLATGQHIGFFQRRTLEVIGEKLDLKFASANGLHVLSRHKINESWLGLVTMHWASLVSAWWIRKKLGSRTQSDHQLMLHLTGSDAIKK